MEIDHIFIFTDSGGNPAEQLIDFGLTEGSNRIHHGQGTANRKFYFENFFLELLWVHDQNQIGAEKIRATGLTDRTNFRENNYSPFGLCLLNSENTDSVFSNSESYQPEYFPEDKSIDIIKNEVNPGLPWVFRLPFKGVNNHDNEPTVHRNGIKKLTKAVFEYSKPIIKQSNQAIEKVAGVEFIESKKNWLTLIFDNREQGLENKFDDLKLIIQY